jgi:hypothetical protein
MTFSSGRQIGQQTLKKTLLPSSYKRALEIE